MRSFAVCALPVLACAELAVWSLDERYPVAAERRIVMEEPLGQSHTADVEGDGGQLQQLIMNLVINGAEAIMKLSSTTNVTKPDGTPVPPTPLTVTVNVTGPP